MAEVGKGEEGAEEPEEGWAEEEHGEEEWLEESAPVSGLFMMPLFVGVLVAGAACSVLSEGNKECYKRASRGHDVPGRYLADRELCR